MRPIVLFTLRPWMNPPRLKLFGVQLTFTWMELAFGAVPLGFVTTQFSFAEPAPSKQTFAGAQLAFTTDVTAYGEPDATVHPAYGLALLKKLSEPPPGPELFSVRSPMP